MTSIQQLVGCASAHSRTRQNYQDTIVGLIYEILCVRHVEKHLEKDMSCAIMSAFIREKSHILAPNVTKLFEVLWRCECIKNKFIPTLKASCVKDVDPSLAINRHSLRIFNAYTIEINPSPAPSVGKSLSKHLNLKPIL